MSALELWTRQSNLFNQLFSDVDKLSVRNQGFIPYVDIREDQEGFHFRVDLPGMNEKDIEVEINGKNLTISGERKTESDRQEQGFHLVERGFGKFRRSFQLPDGANGDKVNARYDNGVLQVVVEKKPEIKPRRITLGS